MSSLVNEKELIKGCLKRDRKAQQKIYDHFAGKMFVIALRYSKSDQEAEDVLQESFIKVFDHIKQLKKGSSLEAWIRRIVINTALNHQRSKLYMFPMSDVTTAELATTDDVSLSGFSLQELLGMIQSLPSGCQVIFNLYAIEGYNHKEIAKMLKISEGTSKSQYSRAKSLLKEMIEKSENVNYGQL